MAVKTRPIFNNLSSGEITPKLDGRVDLAQYYNGLQELSDWICVPQGGAKTRGGFHFVAETKNNENARLIPFRFSELQNYMLEFGDLYIRFFMDSGQIYDGLSPYEIVSPYAYADDLWLIRFVQDDENLYLVHPVYPPYVLTKGAGHTSFTITEMDLIDGPYEDEITTPTITPSGTTGNITLTASAALFDEDHIGALWRIKHTTAWGYVEITAFTSTTVVSATVKSALDGSGTAAAAHREGAWSDYNGWPRAICFHEGKLLFASTFEHPQAVWASKSGSKNYANFTPGTLDNDPYTFVLSDLNIIRWLSSGRVLAVGALNVEASAVGPNDGPITATDPPRIKTETTHGSSALLAPVKVGKSILFLQKSARKIREFAYTYVEDAYGASDITLTSEHLFDLDIYDLIYQQEPGSLLWALRSDGVILPCAYDRSVDPEKGGIVAWSTLNTDGLFESIESIPYANEDQVWAVVQRDINDVTKRYIEYYDENICVDSGLTYSGPPATVLEGLEHLEGKTVAIVGDGAPYPSQVVPASGELTIDPAASEIYVGIAYIPKMITNRPEVQLQGTSQGLMKAWSKIIVRVLNTTGITINGQVVPARSSTELMGSAPAPFSGDIEVQNLGWNTEGRIEINQTLPLPAHIVSITGDLIIGNG